MDQGEDRDTGISGLILDQPEETTIGNLVEEVIVFIRLSGQRQVYAFDVTDNEDLVTHIINEIEEEVPN